MAHVGMLLFTIFAFIMISIISGNAPANCTCYNPSAGGGYNNAGAACTTSGCSRAGGTVDCDTIGYSFYYGSGPYPDPNGYNNGLINTPNLFGCNCPADSYTGSVYASLNTYPSPIGSGFNGNYYDGNNHNGYNYSSCSDFGNGAAAAGDSSSDANNAIACCTYCCYPINNGD